MTTTRFTKLAVILSSAAIISYSAAAHAGFEWKGPLEAPAPQPSAAPAETGSMSDLAPVTSESAAPPAMASAPAAAPMAAPAPAPAPATPMASAPMAEAPAAAPAPAASGDVVAGFAKDVPLVMALQQIVPPGFQYSFSSGVDAGTSVSWEGGKPWQAVLNDMLSPHGLGYTLQNNTVVVGASQGSAAPAPAAAPTPAQDAMMTPMPSDSSSAPASAPSPAPEQSANSNAPLNIVSQPPQRDASAAPSPAPAAAPQESMMANPPQETASATPPQDNAAAAAPAKKDEPVTIHRNKPKTLLERLGFVHRRDNTAASQDEARMAGGKPQKVAAADVPAPKPDAAPATANDAAPVAVAQPAAAMTAVAPSGAWQGMKGQTLRDVLKAWSDKAGVDLYWSIDYDYRLSDDVGLSGSYDEAVGTLLDKFASVRPQPYGQLHQGSKGPRVLVIKSYDLAQ